MKTIYQSLAALALLAFFFTPELVRAQDDSDDQGASFQTFYDQLGNQGTWIQADDYGYVFQPNVSDPNWAPYTDGHWVYTDQGWTWVSDEPWGWATYHYGRWANIDGTGWVWVPGYQWAPAWVSWRYGGGYAGWAPLPPGTFVGAEYGEPGVNVGIGFHFGNDVDVSFGIGAGCYNFVPVGDLCQPDYRGRYIDRNRNFVIINNTTNVTNINVNRNGQGHFGRVSAGGPSLAAVNAHSSRPFETVHLAEANQPGKSTLQGNSLAVFAPRMNPATVSQAKPAVVAQTINHPTFNRGDSIAKPLAVTASVKPAPPSAAAIQAARQAQAHVPASARIVTTQTPIKKALAKPLTSLAPVTQVHQTTSPVTNPNTVKPNNVTPNVEHNPANAGFTGESVKPPVTESPENKPAPTYKPEVPPAKENEANPAPFVHPENQGNGGGSPPHPQVAPVNHPAPVAPSGNKPPPGGAGPAPAAKDKDKNTQP